jgi:hypothetical protein
MSNADPTPNADSILSNSAGPQSVSTDGLTVTSRSAADQIAALQQADANRIARKRSRGVLLTRFVPGSAVGEERRQ